MHNLPAMLKAKVTSALNEYIRGVYALLDSLGGSDRKTMRLEVVHEGTQMSQVAVPVVSVPHLVSIFRDQITGSDVYKTATENLSELPATDELCKRIRPEGDSPQHRRAALYQILFHLPPRVSKDDVLEIDDTRLEQVVSETADALTTATTLVRIRAPLLGVSVSTTLDLGTARIRQLSARERNELTAYPTGQFSVFGGYEATCQIEAQQRQKLDAEQTQWGRNEVDALIRALRLWSGLDVRIVGLFHSSTLGYASGGVPGTFASHYFPRATQLRDEEHFIAFWQRVQRSIAAPFAGLDVALRRFDTMFEQPRRQDRVVDQMIILESLFQKGDERMELSYRLSLRVARFAGTTTAERKDVFSLMSRAYKLRSRVVHGDTAGTDDASLQKEIDSLIQRVLMSYAEVAAVRQGEAKLQAKICDELDLKAVE